MTTTKTEQEIYEKYQRIWKVYGFDHEDIKGIIHEAYSANDKDWQAVVDDYKKVIKRLEKTVRAKDNIVWIEDLKTQTAQAIFAELEQESMAYIKGVDNLKVALELSAYHEALKAKLKAKYLKGEKK